MYTENLDMLVNLYFYVELFYVYFLYISKNDHL